MDTFKIRSNSFYHYAQDYRKHLTPDDEIEKMDMTDIMFQEFLLMLKNKEFLNVNINGPQSSGKSTAGMSIVDDLLLQFFHRHMSITDIDRDQQDFLNTMKNPDIKDTIRLIDEWNEMEETGANSTLNDTLYSYFSNVHAQRFIHKFSCSPKSQADRNADILLEVIPGAVDKVNKITYCKLYYKIFSAGTEIPQLLGHVCINVSNIVDQPWYLEYRKRKFERMDLLIQKGIFRPRVIEEAPVVRNVLQKLKVFAFAGIRIERDLIRDYIKNEAKKQKQGHTMLVLGQVSWKMILLV